MIKEKGAEVPKEEEKPPELHLSAKDYEGIGWQALKVDPSLAHAYFKQAGWPEKDIQKALVEAGTPEKGKTAKIVMSPREKKEMYEKIAAEEAEKAGQTGGDMHRELARVYFRAAEKEAQKMGEPEEKTEKKERE